MAYASLLSITQSLEQILHPSDQPLVLDETEQHIIRTLMEKASFLLSFLENNSLKYGDSNLESMIRDVAYEVEAMIESGFPHQNFEGSRKIVEELDSVFEEVAKMKETNQIEDLPPTTSLPTSSESSSRDKTDIVGLRDEIMEIKDRLTGSPSRLEIISIVGMPGIGKTTLTQTLYDDPLIMKHFDVRAWITVSADHNLQQMLTGLLDSLKNINHGSDLADRLHKTLKKRRYLIVMDDVWDATAWDQVRRFFPNDNNGSRVILTTRLQDVAEHVECPDSIYPLGLLSPDDSWKLLCKKVFRAEPCPSEFEDTGKEIANNCKGLALSLAVIGGILYKAERRLDYWRYVKQNLNFVLNNGDDQVMEILSLSYKHLPHHLRPCFLYMGIFPEDHKISKSKLIKLWIAEGFIKPTPLKCLEEVAFECLENLIDRNMIFVRKHNYAGRIKKCGIHDLMRDLCMRIAREEKFLKVVYSELEIPHDYNDKYRHVSINSYSHTCRASIYGFLPNSILYFPSESQNSDRLSRILSSHELRVLDDEEFFLSHEIYNLVGLRYISYCLHGGRCKILSSISKLLNLQTLVITSSEVVILPMEIWMMPQLRHISTSKCFLPYPFDGETLEKFVPLKNLQTLKGVVDFRFSEDAIGMMPNVKKLQIRFHMDRSDIDLSSYCIGNLVLLQQLEALDVCLRDMFDTKYPLPEIFPLPPNLKKLSLRGLRLSTENMASIGSLQHLEELNLFRTTFDGSLWEPTEGEFLQLKSLYIHETDLEYLKADETNFPMLQSLRLEFCTELIEIPSEIGYIQNLRLIKLLGCPNSVVKSLELIREEQQDLENNRLHIVFKSAAKFYESLRRVRYLEIAHMSNEDSPTESPRPVNN